VSSVQFGMDIRSDGYNIFAMGPMGTGKSSTVFDFLSRQAASLPAPDDWVYVHNFATPHQPNAIRMPAGQGKSSQIHGKARGGSPGGHNAGF